MTDKEKQQGTEEARRAPLAQEVALLFSKLVRARNVSLRKYSSEIAQLGTQLLPHAKNLNAPIDREAFMRPGPGVAITDVKNHEGDVLGWTFEGEYRTARNIGVTVEKTDEYNGSGVRLGVYLKEGEQSLSIWAVNGAFGSGRVDVEFMKNGKVQTAAFERKASLLGAITS